jgi:hypothetical protein
MGKWSVDNTTQPGILRLSLDGIVTIVEMTAFVTLQHLVNKASIATARSRSSSTPDA